MGQEFFINSQQLQNKIDQLLPSQGGAGPGFDLSASTQIIPIVDLTESAEGSNLRADLQSAISLTTMTAFSTTNTTDTIINNTGYFRIFGYLSAVSTSASTVTGTFSITDGATSKAIWTMSVFANATVTREVQPFDFIVFCEAGDSILCGSNNAALKLDGCTRQIADIDGNLTNP